MPSKKEQCKEIMLRLFGPASAAQVEEMDEEDVVEICRERTRQFLGEDDAKVFDNIE